MGKELLCPKCGSSNIVIYKRACECFDCGYKWRKSQSERILGRKIALPLWLIVIIALLVITAVAIPVSWYLFAQASITVKKGSATVTITPVDIGSVTIDAGNQWRYTAEFSITVEGGTATIDGIIIGFDQPPEHIENMFYSFGISEVEWGNDPDVMTSEWTNILPFIIEGQVTSYWQQVASENGWTYYKYGGHYSLTPGTWYFKVYISGTAQYPTEDLTANFKFYFDVLT